MGLDMYLIAKLNLGHWSHTDPSEKTKFLNVLDAIGLNKSFMDEGCPSMYLDINVAYWRKANQVHHWFVKNIQNGIDDCRTEYASREILEELVKTCRKAINDKGESMPTKGGFFFGSQEIDEYYYRDLDYTIKRIEFLIHNPLLKDFDFYYHSSW